MQKPDVIVVSESDAQKAQSSGEQFYSQEEVFLEVATSPPVNPFEWRSIHTFVEFKKLKNKIQPPPKLYTLGHSILPQEQGYLTLDESDMASGDMPHLPASTPGEYSYGVLIS